MRISSLLSAALSLSCAGCSSIPWVYPLVRPAPLNGEVDQGVHTTKADPVLHRQHMANGPLARVRESVHVADGAKTYHIAPDNLMFAARMMTNPPQRVFCTYDQTYDGKNIAGVRAVMRTCLADPDGDGDFDTVHAVNVGNFSRNVVNFSADIRPSAPYAVIDTTSDDQVEIIIKFEPQANGPAQLQVMYVDGIFETKLRHEDIAIPDASRMPATVTILGAIIDLVGYENGVLSYRVRSGFDPQSFSVVDLPPQ